MFEFIDIYPTLADIMGLDNVPDHLEGRSFAEIVADPEKEFRDNVKAVVRRGDFLGRMVKTKEWRYIEWDAGKQGAELYNQLKDPQELNNLADDKKSSPVIAEMKTLLAKK